jgi:hypothetical protein
MLDVVGCGNTLAGNEQGFLQVGEIGFRPPEPLLIENILMK